MGATPVCQTTAAGCIRPTFADCLTYFQTTYRAIYGQDVVLSADVQDGQLIALLANALHDVNGEALAAYNAYSPSTAQGAGLSSNVKINGIRRKSPTYSTCDFLCVGQVGVTVTAGIIRDDAGNNWLLPTFVIPNAGQITVTATCQTIGAVALAAGAVTTANGKGAIATITRGWQSVTNPSAATAGAPVEIDAALRQRQALSTALPAVTVMDGLLGAISAVSGVSRLRGYENDADIANDSGLPAHTIALIIDGGDAATLAPIIAAKKPPGVGTYGDVLTTIVDAYGIPHGIRFFRPALVPIAYKLQVRALRGYTTDVRDAIAASLATYTTALGIGNDLLLRRAYTPALLTGDPRNQTYEIVSMIAQRRDTSSDAYGDICVAFNEALTCDPADVTIQVVA